jgi:cation:H+ antiporter
MWENILSVILLIAGMVLLIKGADWFVEGASSIAKAMKIPSLVIGLTLVSIGTSMPEFSVSLQSSLAGNNDLSFGNVIGSNIFNTLVVVGVSAIFIPLVVSKEIKKYDLPILIGIYLLLILFGFVISSGTIEVWEAVILFSLTIIYTAFLIYRSREEIKNSKNEEAPKRKWWLNLILVAIGLAGIIFGGDLVVDNASFIATKLGMSDLLVGLTIVAVGTSLPELVTSMVAAKKGEADIAVGNAIGSSLFNIVLILGFCSIISPATVELSSLVDCLIMLASAVLVFLFSFKSMKVNGWQGILLLGVYAAYLAYIIFRNVAPF